MADTLEDLMKSSNFSVGDIDSRRDELQDESDEITNAIEASEESQEHWKSVIDNETDDNHDLSALGASASHELGLEIIRHQALKQKLIEWNEENADELKECIDLCAELSGENGSTQLVSDDDFKSHAIKEAEDTGAIQRHSVWPQTCIDWDRAADELKVDYTVIDIRGTTFYYRAS